ncbi:hypothetical protein HK105_204817 [Polyrhizophydium stewartii]|uniref:Demethylmenaquinone methyltransferase n=1 Tax=Polyrhizophydium stewartii TaxID=2732419 RepID=A0ABR4N7W8_9FUNG|nr:hypothetical protein HK105_003914 [Polyrhizophydium stewartii]
MAGISDEEAIKLLEPFTSCDVSDALSKLMAEDAGAFGQLTDIRQVIPSPHADLEARVCGPAFTMEFVAASSPTPTPAAPTQPWHHMDQAPPGSVVVMAYPPSPNAVFGGLMAARCKALGVRGAVVVGRVRDMRELLATGVPVFAAGTSTLGLAPFVRLAGVGGSVTVRTPATGVEGEVPVPPVHVATGDIILADCDGVVRIPRALVRRVAALAARNTEIDARCMADIRAGSSIAAAFVAHRGK